MIRGNRPNPAPPLAVSAQETDDDELVDADQWHPPPLPPLAVTRAVAGTGGFGVFGPITEGAYFPHTPAEVSALAQITARAHHLARDPVFLEAAGLAGRDNAATRHRFETLLAAMRPTLSSLGGSVGYLRIDGETNPPLTLALGKHAPDFAIRHELLHIVREAKAQVRHHHSLFSEERDGGLFTKLKLLFREESVVWYYTLKTSLAEQR